MKKILMLVFIFLAQNSFALSPEELGECIYNNTNNVQTLIGLVQQLAADELVSSEEITFELMDEKTKTCLDAELVLVDAYAKGLQNKMENAQ